MRDRVHYLDNCPFNYLTSYIITNGGKYYETMY
jgi:hypothetical protein